MKKVVQSINNDLISKMVMFFLIIQPLLDIYILYKERTQIFGFAIPTLVRIGVLFVIGILSFLVIKINKKFIWLVIYLLLISIYCVLHHLNALGFYSYVPGNFNYTLIQELFYIIRMLIPLFMIYLTYHLEFSIKKISTIITWLVGLISGSIVVTNILMISLGSYSKTHIKGNIFSWFIDNYQTYNYLDLASKGFFNDPNRLAALLILLTSVLMYLMLKTNEKKYVVLAILQMLAMFMLGTKAATYGFIIVLVGSSFTYLFFALVKKELKVSKKMLIVLASILIVYITILPFCPSLNRNEIDARRGENYKKDIEGKTSEGKAKIAKLYKELEKMNEEDKKEAIIEFIDREYEEFSINPQFIVKSYPFQYDPYFWLDIMKKPLMERTDFRKVEGLMLKRVKAINNNPNDKYFGITFTRMGNIFDYEKDFESHYFTLGLLGLILLLLPYPIIIILTSIVALLKYQEKFTFKVAMYIMGLGLTLLVAYYSGNVMDGLIVTIILGFLFGQLLREVCYKKEKIKEDKKISVIMPSYNDASKITETLDSLNEQTYKNWELILMDDGSTDNTKEVINQYKQKNDKENKIKYYYEDNQDQLNAIINAMKYITGDYVFILHSDDMLASSDVFERAVETFNMYPKCDALIADLIIIDSESRVVGEQEVLTYKKAKTIPPIQLLWLGRNLYVDVAFYRVDVFKNQVYENYLKWNMPFWLSYNNEPIQLNVMKVDFSFLKYRVYDENYIKNELGKLNVINGELRTATRLMKYYDIPYYKFQYKIFRILNKLNLLSFYVPYYLKRETINKAEILKFIINKRLGENYTQNLFLNNLISFYEKDTKRSISIEKIKKDEFIYFGKDIKLFNKQLLNGELSDLYQYILTEMGKGFNNIKVSSVADKEKVINIIKFLCLYPYVKITLNKKRVR